MESRYCPVISGRYLVWCYSTEVGGGLPVAGFSSFVL